jgi:hypothetical protein
VLTTPKKMEFEKVDLSWEVGDRLRIKGQVVTYTFVVQSPLYVAGTLPIYQQCIVFWIVAY